MLGNRVLKTMLVKSAGPFLHKMNLALGTGARCLDSGPLLISTRPAPYLETGSGMLLFVPRSYFLRRLKWPGAGGRGLISC
jgi:hypothetical protein